MLPLVIAQASGGDLGVAQALVGLPVAAVIVAVSLYVWRLLSTGRLVLGREYSELRDDRDFWRTTAIRALNVGEAVASRRTLDPP